MAESNNKLRLQIVTQLDAAGIKATKDQVDQLELGLRRAGNAAGGSGEKFGQLEKALGKLPGRLGEIAGKMGGLVGQATMVAGAFSMGVEIGNKICEVAKNWGLMEDPLKTLKKENAEYNQQLQQLKDSLEIVTAAEMKRMEVAATSADASIKKIDEQTAAYFRQATSLDGLKKSQGNAEMMQLERAKFEDMKAYSEAGYGDAAEQIGRYYDVLKAELAAKQEIEAFDRESAKLVGELTKSEQAYAAAADRAAEATAKKNAAEAALAEHRATNGIGGNAMYTNEADVLKDDELEKIAQKAAKDAERAQDVLSRRAAKLETVDADNLARKMERANIVAGGTLNVDRAAQAYDDFVSSNGNPLNAEIDANWAADLLSRTVEADQTQKEILAEVKAFGQLMQSLLEVK